MKPKLPTFGWTLLAGIALLTAAQSVKYLAGNPDDLHPIFRAKYFAHWGVVFTHGAAAITALVLGPFQFLPGLRRWSPRAHRLAGGVYFFCVVVGGVTGFRMGMMAYGGALAQVGFCIAGAAWAITAWLAIAAAARRDFRAHEAWMIRNYALAFGAVALRIELPLLQLAGFEYSAVYPFIPWTAWVPCALAAEVIILGGVRRALGRLLRVGTLNANASTEPRRP